MVHGDIRNGAAGEGAANHGSHNSEVGRGHGGCNLKMVGGAAKIVQGVEDVNGW